MYSKVAVCGETRAQKYCEKKRYQVCVRSMSGATYELTTDLDAKRFVSAVAGVCKQTFGYGDAASAVRAVRKATATSSSGEAATAAFVENVAGFLAHAGRLGWGATEVAAAAAGDVVEISDAHAAALVQFWKGEVGNVRRALAADTTFNKQLTKFTWRIDIKGGSLEAASEGEPCALLEMQIAERVRFRRRFWPRLVSPVYITRHYDAVAS